MIAFNIILKLVVPLLVFVLLVREIVVPMAYGEPLFPMFREEKQTNLGTFIKDFINQFREMY